MPDVETQDLERVHPFMSRRGGDDGPRLAVFFDDMHNASERCCIG